MIGPLQAGKVRGAWPRRVAWLALIWAASVAALAIVAAALKVALTWAGLTT